VQTNAVTDALRMAWFRRRPPSGLIFHSDRGSQYCSHELQGALEEYEMKSSMSRKGNCWDNVPTESLWGRLKVGRLYGRRFATRREAMDEAIDWLNFYNHTRDCTQRWATSALRRLSNAGQRPSSKTGSPHNWQLRSPDNEGMITSAQRVVSLFKHVGARCVSQRRKLTSLSVIGRHHLAGARVQPGGPVTPPAAWQLG